MELKIEKNSLNSGSGQCKKITLSRNLDFLNIPIRKLCNTRNLLYQIQEIWHLHPKEFRRFQSFKKWKSHNQKLLIEWVRKMTTKISQTKNKNWRLKQIQNLEKKKKIKNLKYNNWSKCIDERCKLETWLFTWLKKNLRTWKDRNFKSKKVYF